MSRKIERETKLLWPHTLSKKSKQNFYGQSTHSWVRAIKIVTIFRRGEEKSEKAGKCLSIVIKNFFITLDKCFWVSEWVSWKGKGKRVSSKRATLNRFMLSHCISLFRIKFISCLLRFFRPFSLLCYATRSNPWVEDESNDLRIG